MSALIDLTDQTFHWLKAIRPLEPGTHGDHRRWLCQCRCGQMTTATSNALRSGNKKSCGCLKRSGRIGRPFTKARARAAYRATARQFLNGKWWLAPREAARYLQVHLCTIQEWQDACPFLDGEGIRTRLLSDGLGKNVVYSALADLDKIRDARTRREKIPAYPELVRLEDAMRELRVSRVQLYFLLRRHAVATERKPGKDARGRHHLRPYVPRDFVEARKEEKRRQAASHENAMTVTQAATALKTKPGRIHYLVDRGILPVLSDKSLSTCKPRRKRGRPFRRYHKRLLIPREAVQEFRDQHPAGLGDIMPTAESRGRASAGPLPETATAYPTRVVNDSEHAIPVRIVGHLDAARQPPSGALDRPRWDGSTLWFGADKIRPYPRTSENQGQLLKAFETAGWPESVPNPFTGRDDPESMLSQTVRDLNRGLPIGAPLRFGQTNKGRTAVWRGC